MLQRLVVGAPVSSRYRVIVSDTYVHNPQGITIHFGTMDIVAGWRVTDSRGFCECASQNSALVQLAGVIDARAKDMDFRIDSMWI